MEIIIAPIKIYPLEIWLQISRDMSQESVPTRTARGTGGWVPKEIRQRWFFIFLFFLGSPDLSSCAGMNTYPKWLWQNGYSSPWSWTYFVTTWVKKWDAAYIRKIVFSLPIPKAFPPSMRKIQRFTTVRWNFTELRIKKPGLNLGSPFPSWVTFGKLLFESFLSPVKWKK